MLDKLVLAQEVVIGSDLEPKEEEDLVSFLQRNKYVFAWSAKDLTGVDRNFIEHRLSIDKAINLEGKTLENVRWQGFDR